MTKEQFKQKLKEHNFSSYIDFLNFVEEEQRMSYADKYSLTKEEYDNFTLMNVRLTRDVWERYRKDLLPALQRADWEFLNNTLEGSFSFDPDDLPEPVKIPALIIAAKLDSEVGYKDQFDLMEKYVNSTYCAVENAGHNLQIEQPEIFENVLTSWL